MTRTGYSCASMRRKNKPGCSSVDEHYCSESGKRIDPMSCHVKCETFKPLACWYKRPVKKEEVELL